MLFRSTRAAAITGLALLLGACTISSEKPLLEASEGAAPLPDAFTFYPYQKGDDGYVRTTDAPAHFERHDNVYSATDLPDVKGNFDVRFVPEGDDYLMEASGPHADSAIYGFAHFSDGVLTLSLTPDKDTAAAIDRERHGSMPITRKALAGLSISGETSSITLTSRASLDYLAGMYAAGHLPMGTISVAYLSEDPDIPPPSRLVQAGDHWIKVP